MNTQTDTVELMAGRRNLYVAAEDRPTWERAEQLAAPESLSSLVTGLLRRYVEQRDSANDRIVVVIDDGTAERRKAFKGRMLVRHFTSQDDYPGRMAGVQYHAAQGAKGGLALWDSQTASTAATFRTYETFEEAAAEDFDTSGAIGWPEDFLSAISATLGEEYAEEIEL